MTAVGKKGRNHVSKNRKKSWRKHCDIKDVEDFLEDQRLEERTGGSIFDKPNEELFYLDTSKKGGDEKEDKVPRGLENLKCHAGLKAYSEVPPPVNPQRRPLGKRKRKLLAKVEEKKLKKILGNVSQKLIKKKSSPRFHDLWSEDKKETPSELVDLINYRDEITKKRPVKVPAHRYQKPSLLPAVEVPHPGASYNPSYNTHQELLSEAVKVEQKKLKEELHLKRVLFDMFPKKADAPTEETWVNEMSQGLFDEDDKTIVGDDDTKLFANPAVTDEYRKSKSKRRKIKELKFQLRQQTLEKLRKRKMNDVFRIKSLKAEIKQAEKISEEKQARKQQREIEKMYKPRTLSKYKFQPNDLEVNLSEELPDAMRALKVEGNLLEDRYKSLQKRNIIEPRIRQKRKRKYKLKVQIKRSHRDPEIKKQKK